MNGQLYRSRDEKIIAGVCGGLGEYLKMDPTLVRILFVVIAAAGGASVLAYAILWAFVPLAPPPSPSSDSPPPSA
jgi:phage shock protein C